MSARDKRSEQRVRTLNEDAGWEGLLATPNGRAALWGLYKECIGQGMSAVRTRADGEASSLMTFRELGKRDIALFIENRAQIVNHLNWLKLLAENQRPMNDGLERTDPPADPDGEQQEP